MATSVPSTGTPSTTSRTAETQRFGSVPVKNTGADPFMRRAVAPVGRYRVQPRRNLQCDNAGCRLRGVPPKWRLALSPLSLAAVCPGGDSATGAVSALPGGGRRTVACRAVTGNPLLVGRTQPAPKRNVPVPGRTRAACIAPSPDRRAADRTGRPTTAGNG